MKRRTRALAFLLLLSLLVAALSSGCVQSRELNELVIVTGMGIDVDPDEPGNVKLIAQIVLPSKIVATGEPSKAYVNTISTGTNTFEAMRHYTHLVSGKLYIPHNQVIVIGRRRAEEGIARVLDFFVRAKESRPTVYFFIADTTAEDVLDQEVASGDMPAMLLGKLIDATEENTCEAFAVNLVDYLIAMQSASHALLVPIVRITNNGKNTTHEIRGMAVFREDRLVGELSGTQVRGLAWVTNRIKSCVINVPIEDGIAALEVISAKGGMIPELSENGKIVVKMEISVLLKLSEQTCVENLSTPEHLEHLEGLVGEKITDEIMRAFERSLDLGADIFGFNELVRRHMQELWHQLDQEQLLLMVEPKINVTARITGAGSLEKPAWAARPEMTRR